MKLRNKKTGEIMDDAQYRNFSLHDGFGFRNGDKEYYYHSLAELNAEWEDAPEEPKRYWFINPYGVAEVRTEEEQPAVADRHKQFGNYFETREEVEEAIEKLKAWQRLKDKGFRFILDGETEMPMFVYSGANGEKCITSAEESKQCRDDIKLLFGGEK